MAQTTAIITQLVFEHALRIRVKSETGDKKKDAPDSSEPLKKTTANLLGRVTTFGKFRSGAHQRGAKCVVPFHPRAYPGSGFGYFPVPSARLEVR